MNSMNLRCGANLRDKMRLLWSQHVYRTRLFIISAAASLADLSETTAWLLQNPGDFAEVLRQFYGAAKAAEFEKLFTEHLTIAGELVTAAKNGEAQKAAEARNRWYQNAEEIAALLSCMNPCRNFSKWQKMLFDHLAMTENEAVFRLGGRFREDIAEFNRIEAEAMRMADCMTDGIITQFKLC